LTNAEQIILKEKDILDFDSAIPYYYQLFKYIEGKIKTGEWRAGQKLPSEGSLCEHFGVSRTVVRQALQALASANLVETFKGKGSFVSAPKHAWLLMQSLTGFYQDAEARGQKVSTRVLELKVIPATDEVAELLKLAEGTPVICLRRLRFVGGEPVVVVVTYIPEHLCPGLVNEDFTGQSLYRLLAEKYGLVIAEGVRTIESINAPPDLAHLLGVPAGAALSLLKSVGLLADGTPLEYYIAWHRGDRSRFRVRLVNPLYHPDGVMDAAGYIPQQDIL
jgi:GntR family transcriptional regulator